MVNPLVSVCMITYMHEDYIAKAIEGVLMQKVDFEVELIIVDDASPDNTKMVVNDYNRTHPNGCWIRYVRHEKNVGVLNNFAFSLQKCRGKYIALCEGDDFWTDPLKLKTQVDFLNEHEGYTACAHNALIMFELLNNQQRVFNNRDCNCDFYFHNFLGHRPFHTASLFFRAKYLNHMYLMPEIFSGDRFLFLLVSQFGPIYYSNKIMCVYRKNIYGISQNVNSYFLLKDKNMLKAFNNISNIDKIAFLKYFHGSIFYNCKDVSIFQILEHSFFHCIYTLLHNERSVKYLFIYLFNRLPKKIIYIIFSTIRKWILVFA